MVGRVARMFHVLKRRIKMMTGFRQCFVAAAAVLGASTLASATVIQYQPHDQQRGVILGDMSEFTDDLGLWVENISDDTQSATQISYLGSQVIGAWREASGPDAASILDVRFSVSETVPFELNASTTARGLLLVLRDLTVGSFLTLYVPTGADSAEFSGTLTGGHDFALLSTLQDPDNAAPNATLFFSIYQDSGSPTLVPTPGAAGLLAMAGIAACARRRRA